MQSLNDYIITFEQIIPDTLCDKILNEYTNTKEWFMTGIGTDGEPNTKVRNCEMIEISQGHTIGESHQRREIDRELFDVAGECIQKYNDKFLYARIQEDTGYELLRYNKGGFYIQHTDSFLQAPRLITASFILNNDYEGGEFGFFNNTLKYKLNKGDVIMFPATFMYPHQINPVTKGTRYSIVTWFR